MIRPTQFYLNRSHKLAKGLVFAGLGRFSKSTHYHDSSLYGKSGTLTDFTTLGTAWQFMPELGRWVLQADRATPEYVALGAMPGSGEFTLTFWLNWSSYSTFGFIFGGTSTQYEDSVYVRATNQLGFGRPGQASGATKFGDGTAGNEGEWNHFAIHSTAAGNLAAVATAWKNGIPLGNGDDTSISSSGIFAAPTLFRSAIGSASTYALTASSADVALHRRLLSKSEIETLADRSDPTLDGLIVGTRRRNMLALSGVVPPPATLAWLGAIKRQQVIGGGVI